MATEQQHEQAISYWREVAREGEAEKREAVQHIRQERQEEDAERTTARRGQSI